MFLHLNLILQVRFLSIILQKSMKAMRTLTKSVRIHYCGTLEIKERVATIWG